jgi:hypothetical protein
MITITTDTHISLDLLDLGLVRKFSDSRFATRRAPGRADPLKP